MAAAPPKTAPMPAPGERTVRRIEYLTPSFGLACAVIAAFLRRWGWAEGLLVGAALGWLNFRWLKKGLAAFTSVAANAAAEKKSSGSPATSLSMMFRYALIGLAVYVSFKYLRVPLLSVASGLCALAVAIIAASVWEIVQSAK
jgi:hypothetical protein